MTSNASTSDDYTIKETATLNWTINGFTNYFNLSSKILSDPFCQPKSENVFQLWITSPMNLDDIYISLYYGGNESELPIRYRVSIMNANGKKQYTQEYRWNFSKTNLQTLAQHHFCRINDAIFIACNSFGKYLVNGNMSLYCEVDVLEKVNHQANLQRDYQALLDNSGHSDVIFLVKTKEFKAHKAILCARSDVFREMFSNDLEEKKQNRVEITDVEVDVFEHLLRYIYTGKILEMDDCALELFAAADKYQLDHLKSTCLQSLGSTLKVDSVVQVLVIADMHNASELKSKCLNFINVNSSAVIATEKWKQIISRPDLLMELYEKKSDLHDTKKKRTKLNSIT